MNNQEIIDAIEAKANKHNIDMEFLYPAVICMGKNILASEDDICRAYFNSELRRHADAPPEAYEPVSDRMIEITSRGKHAKPIAFFVTPGDRINELHLQIYQQLLYTKALLMASFVFKVPSGKIDEIISYLCDDIIQSIRNSPDSLN